MNIPVSEIRKKIAEKGLKVTPQRVSILEAVCNLHNHPTADNIIEHVHRTNPNIATGTVYKVLETLVENQLIRKVKTDKDVMRYDGIMENHHHLYCTKSDLIKDYVDRELDELLGEYFAARKIRGFHIEDIVVEIKGTFDQ